MAATSRCWTVNAVCWRSWRSNVLVHPNAFYCILTMTGNRASSFERRGATCPSHQVHPVPRQLARTRRAMTSVAAWRKIPVFVKMLFCSLREPGSYPVNASCLGLSAQSLYCCPVSRRCSVEWVSGQEFFCTETARGPRRATEKSPPPTQWRHKRRHKMLPTTPDRCFNPPLRQFTVIANPKSRAVRSRSASTATLSGLREPPACLRVKTENRMNERAICPLPLAGTPRLSPRPGGDRAARIDKI